MWTRLRLVTGAAWISVQRNRCEVGITAVAVAISLLFFCLVSGERHEHIVERRATHRQIDDLHPRFVESPNRVGDHAASVRDGDRETRAGGLDLAVRQGSECTNRGGNLVFPLDDEIHELTADLPLDLR